MALKIQGKEVGERQQQYMTSSQTPDYYDGVDLTTLKPKMKRFAQHYVATVNIAESCRSVGYNESSGHRLLKRADVKAYIQWLITEQSNADIMTATEVLEHLTKIAKRDGYDEIVTAKGDKIQARISTKDQLTALQQLAKFHDLLTPDVQVNNELNIIVDIAEPEDDEEEIKQAEAVEDDALEADFEETDEELDYGFLENY